MKSIPEWTRSKLKFLIQETELNNRFLFEATKISEKKVTTHSSNFAWEIPGTEQPGGLQSLGLQRVGYDLAKQQQDFQWFVTHIIMMIHDWNPRAWEVFSKIREA